MNWIDELDGRYRDLLFQEHCKKLFNLMNIFLCDIKYTEVGVISLLKLKTDTSMRNLSQKSNGRS